jgi:hypothetical protein
MTSSESVRFKALEISVFTWFFQVFAVYLATVWVVKGVFVWQALLEKFIPSITLAPRKVVLIFSTFDWRFFFHANPKSFV